MRINYARIILAMNNVVRKATNLTLRTDLIEQARALGINLSRTLEAALLQELRRRREAAWREENRVAIDAYNCDLETHGLWSDKLRLF